MQVEEFGREMHKLNKQFLSKARQKSQGQDGKDRVSPRKGTKDMEDLVKMDFAPLKLSSLALHEINEFKVMWLRKNYNFVK